MILIVAGVAGSGKTTVGALLAGRLRWRFADADTFHSEANIAKMRAGIPLTDEDRQPWLHAVTGWIDERIAEGQSGVITCSALKRAYRHELLDGRPPRRWSSDGEPGGAGPSADHPAGPLLPRETDGEPTRGLEPPTPDEERVLPVLAEGDAPQTAAKTIATLWPYGESDQGILPPLGLL